MAAVKKAGLAWPDGIDEAHARPHGGLKRHASPLSVLVLLAVLAWGLSGLAGGRFAEQRAETTSLTLVVEMPGVVRNGEVLEARLRLRAREPIGRLVVSIDAGLWRELTVNSMVPAPDKESFVDGAFRFEYGRLERGRDMLIKIDAQVNPSLRGTNRGSVRVLDDTRPLVDLPISLEVLP